MNSDAGRGSSNRLGGEKSPYLLLHAANPVDWYPWGAEAFERAAREDRPVFLSIGYSTCHWCHVMAHESFEDREVASLMNDAFVCVKVDREERPDLDGIYVTACQMMTGGGGWPLTVLLTPDRRPFFAGTYIPRATRFGRIGMLDFVPRIKEIWDTRRGELLEAAAFTHFLLGLDFAVGPSHEVVVAGDPRESATGEMLRALQQPYLPNKVLLLRPTGAAEPPAITGLAPFTSDQVAIDGQPTVYVCQDFHCQRPTTGVKQALQLLGA